MRISDQGGRAHIAGIPFDAQLSLMDSAQVFHWVKSGDGFQAACGGHAARIARVEDGFEITGLRADELSFWRGYLDLDRDYGALQNSCAPHPITRRALSMLPGLRILRQPPWEALVAFILSANNNVSRIRALVLALIDSLGEPVGPLALRGFPTPEKLAGTDEALLRGLGVGYRAPYLIETARAVAEGFPLEQLSQMPHEEAHRTLLSLKGVGDKVAECVLLFGCGHTQAFPVDVWVERLMRRWFSDTGKKKTMGARAQALFGADAGLVQQYLFHCARLKLIDMDTDGGCA